ncbi:MAG: glycoside hydrolase family 9 protein [Chitinispirillia bacterium]|nr:glycoside hydrolase family 9 protein [Chitinispirillia bacterium]MCL2242094.1 glycoside hydrolase family 9 protein [Chitinispirillia bacterium]
MALFRTKIIQTAILALSAASLTAAVWAQTAGPVSGQIRMNSVGFLPDLPKRASIANPSAPGAAFTVKSAVTGAAAFSGTLPASITRNTDTGDTVRVADFSAFATPGRYYLEVEGIAGRSAEFAIGPDAFNDAYRAMMLGMYLWRCGTAVDATYNGRQYRHAACHLNDGNTRHIGGAQNDTRNATKGWHDAGDYNKYTVNSGITTGMMLKAWEDHGEALGKIDLMPVETANAYEPGMPKFLAEVKWNLDWVATMQYSETDGRVSHKLSATGFCGYIMPEAETSTRFFVPWGTAATASFVAQMALAARVYAPYDKAASDKWLAQARVSYDYLAANQAFTAPTQTEFSTGEYGASSDRDNRLWAAAEMWETTGEAKYLQDFESRTLPNMFAHLGWADVNVLAGITYLMSEKPGRKQSRVDSLHNNLISVAGRLADSSNKHGYGRVFGAGNYYWGQHGALTANSYILNAAYRLTGDEKYRAAAHEILGNMFGRNYFNRSFVTGVGHNPPVDPHCRRSIADESPWPGYIVGGPHRNNLTDSNGNPIAPQGANCPSATPGTCYFDYYADYARNEIAINWNGSMIYALSGFVQAQDLSSIRADNKAAATA